MITVVDLGIGNIGSVLKALKTLNAEIKLTRDLGEIESASKLFLPGVGAFGAGMDAIRKYGLYDPLRSAALVRKIPFFGVCMGMQLLAETGHEQRTVAGLNILQGAEVKSLDPKVCPAIPHMGWNNLETTDGNPILKGLSSSPDFYFVHSFHIVKLPKEVSVSTCSYGEPVTAAIAFRNVFGTQFHPEKSQSNGLKVLRNFLEYA